MVTLALGSLSLENSNRDPDCTLMPLAFTETRWQVATLSLSKSTIGIAIAVVGVLQI